MVRRYAVHKLHEVLLKVHKEGRVTKTDLKKMFGSTRHRDEWLKRLLLKDNLLELEETVDEKGEYYRLSLKGYKLLEVLCDHNIFDALCMVRGKVLKECKWVVHHAGKP